LAPEKPAIAQILIEIASIPLISEHDPEVRQEAIKQIVKLGLKSSVSKLHIKEPGR